jgi:hypothetical protein
MNDMEERLRASTRIVADQITPGNITAFRPPAQDRLHRLVPGRRGGVSARGQRWLGRLIPLAAAAAVIALIAGSLTIAHTLGSHAPVPRTRPAGSPALPAGTPAYYVGLAYSAALKGAQPGPALVNSTRTGKALATIAPPGGEEFTGVSGAADDRTFVLAAETTADATYRVEHGAQTGLAATVAQLRFYLVRLSASGAPSAPAPLAVPAGSAVSDFALSPDGASLAVSTASQDTIAIHVYSLTGRSVRTWSASTYQRGKRRYVAAYASSWTSAGALSVSVTTVSHLIEEPQGLLDPSGPGGNLITAIDQITYNCGNQLTPDGTTLIGLGIAPGAKGSPPFLLQECSFADGNVTDIPSPQPVHYGTYVVSLNDILWTSPTGHELIVTGTYGRASKIVTGIVTGNHFTALPTGASVPYWTSFPWDPVDW